MFNKQEIKEFLFKKLIENCALWSYDRSGMTADTLTDEQMIEKVLLHLDMNEINLLFSIYPKQLIKKVWKQELCALEPRYHSSNVLFAGLYFDIKNPQRYVKVQSKRAVRNNLRLHKYERSIT